MKNILKNLWNGELAPDKVLCHDQDYRQKQQALVEAEKILTSHLDAQGKELLAQFDRCLSELEQVGNELIFSSGFSLAVNLLLEAFRKS